MVTPVHFQLSSKFSNPVDYSKTKYSDKGVVCPVPQTRVIVFPKWKLATSQRQNWPTLKEQQLVLNSAPSNKQETHFMLRVKVGDRNARKVAQI